MSLITLVGQNGISAFQKYGCCTWVIDGHHIQGEGPPAADPPYDLDQPWIYDDITNFVTYHWSVADQNWFPIAAGGAIVDDDFRIEGSAVPGFTAGSVDDAAWRNAGVIIGNSTRRSLRVALDIRPDASNLQEGQIVATGSLEGATDSPLDGITGVGLIWLPESAAFRAGISTAAMFDNVNVGDASIAVGNELLGSGVNSFAFNSNNAVSGLNSGVQGVNNNVGSAVSHILAGDSNIISGAGTYNVVAGGLGNQIINASQANLIGTGAINIIDGAGASSVLSGQQNSITGATNGAISTGTNNSMAALFNSLIGGGGQNQILSTSPSANIFILNGTANIVQGSTNRSGILTGQNNILDGANQAIIFNGFDSRVNPGHNDLLLGGREASSTNSGALTYSSGMIASRGDAQWSFYNLKRRTTNATPLNLVISSLNIKGITIPASRMFGVSGNLVARNPATGDVSHWFVTATIKNVAGVATIVGAPTVAVQAQNAGAAAWAAVFVVTADTFTIQVTGVAATTIDWNVALLAAEVG